MAGELVVGASTGQQVLDWINKITSAAQWVVKFIPGDLDDKLVAIFIKVNTMPSYSAKMFIQELVDTVIGSVMTPKVTPVEPDAPPLFGAGAEAGHVQINPLAAAFVKDKFAQAGGVGPLPGPALDLIATMPVEMAEYAAGAAARRSKELAVAAQAATTTIEKAQPKTQ